VGDPKPDLAQFELQKSVLQVGESK
jgi:hypothetical protein